MMTIGGLYSVTASQAPVTMASATLGKIFSTNQPTTSVRHIAPFGGLHTEAKSVHQKMLMTTFKLILKDIKVVYVLQYLSGGSGDSC